MFDRVGIDDYTYRNEIKEIYFSFDLKFFCASSRIERSATSNSELSFGWSAKFFFTISGLKVTHSDHRGQP